MSKQGDGRQINTFSLWQQTSLITSTLIGVGVLTLPRTTTSRLFEAGWMAPLVSSIWVFLSVWMIASLSRQFPGKTFIEYSPIIWGSAKRPQLGRWLSLPWVLGYLLYMYVSTAIVSRIFGEVVVTSVLLDTPLEVIIITMFLLAQMLCMHEVEVVARVNELLFPLILFPVLFIALASFQKAEWNNMFPLYRASGKALFEGMYETVYSFSGYEIMLIYFAYAHDNTSKVRAGFFGIGIAMFVYTLIVLAGIVVFGFEELQRVSWPTLELVKTTQVPGLILERLESAFLAVWVAAVFTTVANAYYAFVYGLRQLFNKGIVFQRIVSAIMFIPLFFIALWPQNIVNLFRVSSYLGLVSLSLNLGVPILYWIVLLARGMGHRAKERKADG
ncbi:endospore germination permease [Brevibacillus choshinensis]|uniref:GerAB/ArcD/ProY family transporter n=1 Tax=Brevibacillus choshinensis TaxID=54911 RepID=UPI002E1FB2EC|nr:endospore germination permease [Brevibacillus choshinensis]MED4753827.1 endospore germination permease [Brevibacillus choshinensis]MED4781741.1 endospore germination permease [Brevibacillus choshinensis]